MSEDRLVLLEKVAGAAQAETLRGLMEAQGISVLLSQESAGSSTFPVSFGILGEVEILVPQKDHERAKEILDDYYAGKFSEGELMEGEEDSNEADQ